MSFELITLRVYHDGILNKEKEKGGKSYVGGKTTEFLNDDIDRLSYFELRNYVNYLGYDLGQYLLYVRLSKNSKIFIEINSAQDTIEIFQCLNDGDI